jgi:hypothetical protein
MLSRPPVILSLSKDPARGPTDRSADYVMLRETAVPETRPAVIRTRPAVILARPSVMLSRPPVMLSLSKHPARGPIARSAGQGLLAQTKREPSGPRPRNDNPRCIVSSPDSRFPVPGSCHD